MRHQQSLKRIRARAVPLIAAITLMLAMAPFLPTTPVAAQEGQIGVSKLVCPDDFDGMASDLATLASTCVEPGIGFPFALLPEGGDPVETTTDEGALALWTGVPAGSGIITETAAENNLSRVICGTVPEQGGGVNYEEYDATGNAISYTLGEGEGLDCVWYNVSLAPEQRSEVHVTKYGCSEGVDWDLLDRQGLLTECGDVQSGVEFQLVPSDGVDRNSVTDGSGVASWVDIPAGSFSVTEDLPPGSIAARVFCADIEFGEAGDPNYLEYVVDGGNSIDGSVLVNHDLDCVWFDALEELPQSDIDVAKYACPDGYDWTGQSLGEASGACVTPLADIGFVVTGPGFDDLGVTDGNGAVSFAGPPGDYVISEETPPEYGAARTACSIYPTGGAPANYQEFELENNALAMTLDQDESIDCVWFNSQAAPTPTPTAADPGPASITINKYTCPESYDPLGQGADPATECDQPTEDITFSLSDGASASTGTGGAPSTISFSNLQPGRYVVTEEQPDTVAFAFVLSCSSDQRTFVYPFAPFAVIEPDGRLPVELVAGEDLECDWFNVLASPGSGIVTLTKYWCPGELVNFDACELDTGGTGFTLAPLDGVGEEISIETGLDGTVTFEAAGVYDLIEDGLEWCFAESDSLNADGSLEVNAGQAVSISIYNCGEPPPTAT